MENNRLRSLVRPNSNAEYEGRATGRDIQTRYISDKENWLDFCMFPEIATPTRMPSLFPVPTHMVKRQTVGYVKFGPTDVAIKGLFRPDSIATTPSVYVGTDFVYRAYQDLSISRDWDNIDTAGDNLIGAPAQYGHGTFSTIATPSLSQSLAHGGYRLVASTIEFEYLGTLETHAGLIEVGLHIHSRDDNGQSVHLAAESEIVQMPCYRKFKPSDGARMVWFPIDGKDFEFSPMLGTDVVATAAAHKTNVAQWCVNMSGLSSGQTMRVHIQSYYEVIPDEGDFDIYLPRKSNQNASPNQMKQATAEMVNAGAVATPAKSSSVWGQGFETARNFIGRISELYGLYNQAQTDPFGAVTKLFG